MILKEMLKNADRVVFNDGSFGYVSINAEICNEKFSFITTSNFSQEIITFENYDDDLEYKDKTLIKIKENVYNIREIQRLELDEDGYFSFKVVLNLKNTS